MNYSLNKQFKKACLHCVRSLSTIIIRDEIFTNPTHPPVILLVIKQFVILALFSADEKLVTFRHADNVNLIYHVKLD